MPAGLFSTCAHFQPPALLPTHSQSARTETQDETKLNLELKSPSISVMDDYVWLHFMVKDVLTRHSFALVSVLC